MVRLLFWSPFFYVLSSANQLHSPWQPPSLSLPFPIHLKINVVSDDIKKPRHKQATMGTGLNHMVIIYLHVTSLRHILNLSSVSVSHFADSPKANTVIPVCTETRIMGPWSWFELRIINANMSLAALILNLVQFWIFPIDKAFPELHHKHPWVAAQGWALEMSQRPASPDANMFLTVVTPLCIQGLFATVHFKVKFCSFSCLEAPLLLVRRNWNIK